MLPAEESSRWLSDTFLGAGERLARSKTGCSKSSYCRHCFEPHPITICRIVNPNSRSFRARISYLIVFDVRIGKRQGITAIVPRGRIIPKYLAVVHRNGKKTIIDRELMLICDDE